MIRRPDFTRRQIGRLGPVLAATLASQSTSALSSLALPLLGLGMADLYSIGVQLGYSSVGGVAIGVVYSLAIGRRSYSHWLLSSVTAAAVAIALAAVVYVQFAFHGPPKGVTQAEVGAVLSAFGLGGACLGVSGILAVRLACMGRPMPLASVSVGPNLAVFVATLGTWFSAGHVGAPWTVLPAVAFAAVALAQVVIYGRLELPDTQASDQPPPADDGMRLSAVALTVGVVTSTVLPTFYATAVSTLTTGTLYFVGLATKVGTSLVGLGVNSVLLVKYTWSSESMSSFRLPRQLTYACPPLLLSTWLFHDAGWRIASYGAICTAWILTASAAAILLREVNARRLASTLALKVALDLALTSLAAIALGIRPSVVGYFGAYLLSQCITIFVTAWGLREQRASAVSILCIAGTVALVLTGW